MPWNLIDGTTQPAEAGRIAPPVPAWYGQPQSLDDMVDFMATHLDLFGYDLRRGVGKVRGRSQKTVMKRWLLVPLLLPLAAALAAALLSARAGALAPADWTSCRFPWEPALIAAGRAAAAALAGLSAPGPPRQPELDELRRAP